MEIRLSRAKLQCGMHYIWPVLPSVVLTIAALLLSIFPDAVSQFDKRPALRWSITVALIVLAGISGALSAAQTYDQDVAFERLSNTQNAGLQDVRKDIDLFRSQTPRVPRLSIHSDGGTPAFLQESGGYLLGPDLVITNDGDDAFYHNRVGYALTDTLSDLGRNLIFLRLRNDLKRPSPHGPWTILRHGQRNTIGDFLGKPLTEDRAVALEQAKLTAFFAIRLDVRTSSGLKKTLFYCSFFQGRLPVICPYSTL
jgi:hypothetical protein